jgi:uncharacterized membrane protein YecN with MAPEG domain
MIAAPVVTALYAAIIGLLAALLTVNVIRSRVALKIHYGDGGSAPMRMAIRAHANLAQYVALALLLIGLAEMAGTSKIFVHLLGGALVLARLLSAWGLSTAEGPSFGRQSGAGLTLLVLIAASVLILLREGGVPV